MSDKFLTDPRADTWEGWKAAFDIFERHHKPINQTCPKTVYFSAEHDILYLPSSPKPLSAERDDNGEMVFEWASDAEKADGEQLEALGFHWDRDGDCWAKYT